MHPLGLRQVCSETCSSMLSKTGLLLDPSMLYQMATNLVGTQRGLPEGSQQELYFDLTCTPAACATTQFGVESYPCHDHMMHSAEGSMQKSDTATIKSALVSACRQPVAPYVTQHVIMYKLLTSIGSLPRKGSSCAIKNRQGVCI